MVHGCILNILFFVLVGLVSTEVLENLRENIWISLAKIWGFIFLIRFFLVREVNKIKK